MSPRLPVAATLFCAAVSGCSTPTTISTEEAPVRELAPAMESFFSKLDEDARWRFEFTEYGASLVVDVEVPGAPHADVWIAMVPVTGTHFNIDDWGLDSCNVPACDEVSSALHGFLSRLAPADRMTDMLLERGDEGSLTFDVPLPADDGSFFRMRGVEASDFYAGFDFTLDGYGLHTTGDDSSLETQVSAFMTLVEDGDEALADINFDGEDHATLELDADIEGASMARIQFRMGRSDDWTFTIEDWSLTSCDAEACSDAEAVLSDFMTALTAAASENNDATLDTFADETAVFTVPLPNRGDDARFALHFYGIFYDQYGYSFAISGHALE